MVGVYDGDPEQEGRNDHGTNFSFGDNGVLVLTEIGYTPQEGLLDLPGHYKLGGFYHSGDFQDVAKDVNGDNRFVTGLPGNQFSATADLTFFSTRCSTGRKLKRMRALGVLRCVRALAGPEGEHLPRSIRWDWSIRDLLDFRPQDKTALGATTGWFSDKLGDAEHEAGLENKRPRRFSN